MSSELHQGGDGPYVVTTNKRTWMECGCLTKLETLVSRRAVATLDEARERAVALVADRLPLDGAYKRACRAIPESGGFVGPLPDGTSIEVEQVELATLWEHAGKPQPPSGSDWVSEDDILAAYNAEAGRVA